MRPASKGGPQFRPEFESAISVEALRDDDVIDWSCEVEYVGPNNKITVTNGSGFRHTVVIPAVKAERTVQDSRDVMESCLHDTIDEIRRRRKARKAKP